MTGADDPSQAEDDTRRAVAVALRYDTERDDVPRITASGKGAVAEQILAIAFERGVRVREDRDLAELLGSMDVDSPVPPVVMAAVAEILAYVYMANRRMAEDGGAP